MAQKLGLPIYLTLKEIWRNKLRFALVIGVVALLTILVLFTAALAEGLGSGNREYLEKLDGDLIVYQDTAQLQTSSSRMDQAVIRSLRRVEGVKQVGPIAFSSGTIVRATGKGTLDISLVGVVPGLPGEPPVVQGRSLGRSDAAEAIIDRRVADQAGLRVGDTMTLKTVQGTDEKEHRVVIIGLSDGRAFFLRPSVFLPYRAWDKLRAKAVIDDEPGEVIFNIAAVQLDDPAQQKVMAQRLAEQVRNIVAVDRKTAYQATPGYAAQQNTLNTQQIFSLLIGALVVGGFFQIQMLQRVNQIGMLKAIGASNFTIGVAFILQIILVTLLGVAVGGAGVAALALGLPSAIPIAFNPLGILAAVGALVLIGPLGGIVAVRSLLKIEPLTALRLS